MYQKLIDDAQQSLRPVLEAVDINAKAVEKLVAQQAGYMIDVIKANVDHARALSQSADVEAALETQQSFTRSMGSKLADNARQNMDLLLETRDALVGVLESSFETTPAKKPAAKKAA